MLQVVCTSLLVRMFGTYLHCSSWVGRLLTLSSWAVHQLSCAPWVVHLSSYSPWSEWEFACKDNTSKDLAYSMQLAVVEVQASNQQTSRKP